ncbi:hypothetical protein NDN08_002722 [Rhodosorus marinus]|uniref:Twin-arginine translocation signal domain-containing protein n=1 Tax=Rhodosorus marinus TaxID=101924 RepID=A0AAV8UUK4_9RHOD|nr:hypothetical protein NDN08_002722 [Rhodosorus marinus]
MARIGFVTSGVSVTSRTRHCACAVKADEEGYLKVSRAEFLRVASGVTAGIATSFLPQAAFAKKDAGDQGSDGEKKGLFQTVTGGVFQKKEVKRKSPAAEEAKSKAAASIDIEADIGDDMMKRLESRRKTKKE